MTANEALVAAHELLALRVALEARIKMLEERVAFAELGRDNAIVMRDEAQRMKKQAGESAARRINALVALVRELALPGNHPPLIDIAVEAHLKAVEERLDDILKK